MKIALVHDQLQEFGGAERVLVTLKEIFPSADVFTSFYNPSKLGIHATKMNKWNIITSWAAQVPFFDRLYSPMRFLTPLIWESFDFKGYDLVISSSGAFMSKGIITRPETLHICYCHHQPRFLYYYETAMEWQKYRLIKLYGHLINHDLRIWDYLSSQRANYFIANSEETKRRIKKFYRRESEVIYPPVRLAKKSADVLKNKERKYYLTLSRLARAKHIEVMIRAANKKKFSLKIVGEGRDEEYLRDIAGDTVEFLGSLPDDKLAKVYAGAKAFLNAAVDEEFGIAVVEAMGYGLPVIAYASGGITETVIPGRNGYLFHDLNENSLLEQIRQLEKLSKRDYSQMQQTAIDFAQKFSTEQFKERIKSFVSKHINARTSRS